jgi:cysteine desulfurase
VTQSERLQRYFDNAATTPIDPRVVSEMLPHLNEGWGNPHSIHACGASALAAVDLARQRIADLLGAEDPSEVVFTSGATESNNWILRSFDRVAVTPFEHSSVRVPAEHLGHSVLPHQGFELFPPEDEVGLVSAILVNNEIGTLLKLPSVGTPVHRDITQAFGKLRVDLEEIDFASFSGHKMYGPKGIGGLYLKGAQPIEPLLIGGDQENGLRAGTLNVAAIVGFGAAAAIAAEELEQGLAHAENLRQIVLEQLEPLSDWQINGGTEVSPYILSVSFLGLEGETLVIELDRLGFAVSSGSACSSRSTEPSSVLTALGLSADWLRGTVRISFGRFNSSDAARDLGENLRLTVETLRKKHV